MNSLKAGYATAKLAVKESKNEIGKRLAQISAL